VTLGSSTSHGVDLPCSRYAQVRCQIWYDYGSWHGRSILHRTATENDALREMETQPLYAHDVGETCIGDAMSETRICDAQGTSVLGAVDEMLGEMLDEGVVARR